MDTSQISSSRVGDRLPPLSGQHVWLVAQTLEGEDVTGDQVFYTIDDPLSCYQCRIPELLGRRVQGCFHGWVIMSNHPHNVMWSLWNPSSSKLISLPSLNLKEGDINECFLSSPPGDHDSILLLTRKNEPAFVFCRLDRKRKRLRWITMPYDKQLKNITGKDDEFVYGLIRCNGKVYALGGHAFEDFVIEVDIVVNDKVVISLLPFVKLPSFMRPSGPSDGFTGPFLKATCGELFIIYLHLPSKDKFCLRLVKLDMTRKLWEDMEDLDDGICFLNICFSDSNNNNNVPVFPSNLGGGYIHIICQEDKVIHSYNVKDKTLALSSMPRSLRTGESQTCYVSVWAMPECRLEVDNEVNNQVEVKSITNQQDESRLFKFPFHVLEMIMEFCVDIDYVNFRATCKKLTSPVTLLSNNASIRRLQKYSLVSPWLMVLDNDQGVITFTEPMFGDQYSVRTPIELIGDLHIWCSMYGWLLISTGEDSMMLFNPFTSDIRKLPDLEHLFFQSFCLSAPPTSTNCMVIGFDGPCVHIHFVAQEPASWRSFDLNFGDDAPSLFRYSKSYDQDIYALNSEGRLSVFTNFCDDDEYTWKYVDVPPTSFHTSWAHYFLAKCDHDLILVMVGEFGESVELFKVNLSEEKWEKIDGLGKHMIYICDSSCLCVEAKTPEMENKIYFARFHSTNGKIVFYSLDTCRYHTFEGKRIVGSLGDFCGTRRHIRPHAWIDPSYS